MLLNGEQFRNFCLNPPDRILGLDFETTGKSNPRAGDKVFIVGVASLNERVCCRADSPEFFEGIKRLCADPALTLCEHSAKFELAFKRHDIGVEGRVSARVWCTLAMEAIADPCRMQYGLQAVSKRYGLSKLPAALQWIANHKDVPFNYMPSELVEPYVEQDAWLSRKLFEHQRVAANRYPAVAHLELATTKNLFEMEDAGLHLDLEYCYAAISYEERRTREAKERYRHLTAVRFVDSAKGLSRALASRGIKLGRTATGRESVAGDVLAPYAKDEVVAAILEIRDAEKRRSTYWENFLSLHTGGVIYPNINQAGPRSARFSASRPNVQNWPDDSEDAECQYPVRKAFIAPEDHVLVSIDYTQMELTLMADEAGDTNIIDALKHGRDLHQEAASMVDVPRKIGKRGRFLRQYGGGARTMAVKLGITEELAKRLCDAIDAQAPDITRYSRSLTRYAERTGEGSNWLGRPYRFDREFAYKYPNYRIQGGCAEIFRIAIHDVIAFLAAEARPTTKVLIPIHDELVIRFHRSDMRLIPEVCRLMIAAHRNMKQLPMRVGVYVGPNLHDMEEWDDHQP